jgi:hypothetical protein
MVEMSWSEEIKQQFLNERQKAVDSFARNKMQVQSNIEAAYMFDSAPAVTAITTGKGAITTAIDGVSSKIVELNGVVSKLNEKLAEDKTELDETKETVKTAEEELEKERVLNEIRKEQAESLTKKGAGNYHSTWMGLYRPLKEESRTGLAVAAVAFFLIFVSVLVFALADSNILSFIKTRTVGTAIPDLFSGFAQQKNRLFN